MGTQWVLYEGVGRDIPASKNEVQDVFPCEYLPINTLKMVFVFLQIPSLPLKGGQLRYFKLLKNKKDCITLDIVSSKELWFECLIFHFLDSYNIWILLSGVHLSYFKSQCRQQHNLTRTWFKLHLLQSPLSATLFGLATLSGGGGEWKSCWRGLL